jgi:hypothetical protein
MTEEEWLETNNPVALVNYLADRTSERKLRLLACAACRRILHVMREPESHTALEIGERYAEGDCSLKELLRTEEEARHTADLAEREKAPGWNAARTAALVVSREVRAAAERAAVAAADADLVREHFGNPFRPLAFPPEVLSWMDQTVVQLARAAYDERMLPDGTLHRGRLAILADALEEAGCTDEPILTHLRGGSDHYRGCFVLDALLGNS